MTKLNDNYKELINETNQEYSKLHSLTFNCEKQFSDRVDYIIDAIEKILEVKVLKRNNNIQFYYIELIINKEYETFSNDIEIEQSENSDIMEYSYCGLKLNLCKALPTNWLFEDFEEDLLKHKISFDKNKQMTYNRLEEIKNKLSESDWLFLKSVMT